MRSLGRILIEIWRSVKFELLSTLGSLLTIFLAMILSGAFWISSKNMTITEARLKSSMTMDVFLRGELSSDQIVSSGKGVLGAVRCECGHLRITIRGPIQNEGKVWSANASRFGG